jgi:hypothetical protein
MYFEILKSFNEYCETSYLPTVSQLIMFKFLHIFNKFCWKEWIAVNNASLMGMCQINSEKSFINWRDYLVREGLIEYVKGGKGKPNKYKLSSFFIGEKDSKKVSEKVKTREESGEFQGSEKGEKVPDINNINLNLNRNLNNNSSSISPSGDISGSSSAACKKSKTIKSAKKSKFKEFKAKNQFFAMFWDAYPRKEGGETAAKAFEKLSPDSDLMAEILGGIGRYKKSSQWQDQNFIPFPATFLTQRRWEGEVPEGDKNYAADDKPRFKATREYPE